MEFVIIAFDGEDEAALRRRLAARDRHITQSDKAIKNNEQIMGAAILDDSGNMKGSVMIVDFPSRKELDKWLEDEPYVTGDVWKNIQILPCKIGPSFRKVKT